MNIALPGPRWFPLPSLCVLQSRSVPGPDTKNDSMMHAIRSTKGRASDDPSVEAHSRVAGPIYAPGGWAHMQVPLMQVPHLRRTAMPCHAAHSAQVCRTRPVSAPNTGQAGVGHSRLSVPAKFGTSPCDRGTTAAHSNKTTCAGAAHICGANRRRSRPTCRPRRRSSRSSRRHPSRFFRTRPTRASRMHPGTPFCARACAQHSGQSGALPQLRCACCRQVHAEGAAAVDGVPRCSARPAHQVHLNLYPMCTHTL